jgi:hypothetical protein
MRVTNSKGKFTISMLTDSDLISLYNATGDETLRNKIYQVLLESKSEEEILDEFECTPEEFWRNALATKEDLAVSK